MENLQTEIGQKKRTRADIYRDDVVAFLAPKQPIDQTDIDSLEKKLKAVLLVCATWNGKTPVQAKAAFRSAMELLT